MADKAGGDGVRTDLSKEVIKAIPAKTVAGHPFFEVDIDGLIENEARRAHGNADSSESEIQEIIDRCREPYYQLTEPAYDVNNGVYVLVEPHTDGSIITYVTAFPSEKEFERLKKSNSSLLTFKDVAVYQSHVEHEFGLYQNAYRPISYSPRDKEGKYQKSSLFVPLSQHGLTEQGEFKTPLQNLLDNVINNLDKIESR